MSCERPPAGSGPARPRTRARVLGAFTSLVMCALPAAAPAGYFNCSVVYDEFESLMNKEFLVEPDRFVSTVNQRLTRSEFEQLQRGQFLLYEERSQMGIAVFRTNENLRGKLLFHWDDPLADGQVHLVVDQALIYSRVEDGQGVRRIGPFRIKPGVGLDLDSGRYDSPIGEAGSDGAPITVDVRHAIDPDTGEGAFESANEGTLYFPVETMCSETSQ